MLYSNKAAYLGDNDDRRSHNSAAAAERTDLNLTERIKLFKNYIFQKNRIIITLERNLNKLFELNGKVTTIPTEPDVFPNIYARPYISYQEINLTRSADLFFNGILRSETGLRQGVLPAPY